MSAVMLLTMKDMYADKRINLMLYALFAIALVGSFIAIREQSLVGDRQFLRSMIPHHSGAILMCEKAQLRDAEVRELCGQIVQAQKEEIAQMKAIMARL